MTTPNDKRPGYQDDVRATTVQPPFSPGEWGCLLAAAVVGIILVLWIVL